MSKNWQFLVRNRLKDKTGVLRIEIICSFTGQLLYIRDHVKNYDIEMNQKNMTNDLVGSVDKSFHED